MKKKVSLRWSKREKDWVVKYPNRNGRAVGNSFFTMITQFERFMSKDWKGEPTWFKGFREYLLEGGFDPDSFTMSVTMLDNGKEETGRPS